MKKRNYFSDIEDRNENSFSVIADFEGNEEQLMDVEVDEILPVLPLRNMVLFPGVFMPVSVGRKSSLKLVREAEKKGTYIAVVCQKVADTEAPLYDDLHTIGTDNYRYLAGFQTYRAKGNNRNYSIFERTYQYSKRGNSC